MASSTVPADRSDNSTHVGGDGVLESTGTEDATALKVPLREHLDQRTRRSLRDVQSPGTSAAGFATRNRIPLIMAVGGLACLLTYLTRRSARGI